MHASLGQELVPTVLVWSCEHMQGGQGLCPNQLASTFCLMARLLFTCDGQIFHNKQVELRKVVKALGRAGADPRVRGLVAHVGRRESLGGLASVQVRRETSSVMPGLHGVLWGHVLVRTRLGMGYEA